MNQRVTEAVALLAAESVPSRRELKFDIPDMNGDDVKQWIDEMSAAWVREALDVCRPRSGALIGKWDGRQQLYNA